MKNTDGNGERGASLLLGCFVFNYTKRKIVLVNFYIFVVLYSIILEEK